VPLSIAPYRPDQFAQVDALWRACFPDDPPHNRAEVAIPLKLATQSELFLVADDEGQVVGTAMAGWDGHRGWLYSVAVDPAHRRTGTGTALVREAEDRLAALGCTKVNLQVRGENAAVAAFYEGLGYAVEPRVSMGKRLRVTAGA
jgi:ribosomal protein S18 acetylase RimI-like enzyme